jgi:hypothetical protein
LLDEVAIVPLPADAARVERALRRMRATPMLEGARGAPGVDLLAVAQLAQRTGELLIESGLEEIELNPVIASPRGAVAVDALVRPGAAVPALSR